MNHKKYLEQSCDFYIRNGYSVDDYEFDMREKFQIFGSDDEEQEFEEELERCVEKFENEGY